MLKGSQYKSLLAQGTILLFTVLQTGPTVHHTQCIINYSFKLLSMSIYAFQPNVQ